MEEGGECPGEERCGFGVRWAENQSPSPSPGRENWISPKASSSSAGCLCGGPAVIKEIKREKKTASTWSGIEYGFGMKNRRDGSALSDLG